jgi:hypothetical protein
MKKQLTVLALAAGMLTAAPVYAGEAQVEAASQPIFEQTELQALFEPTRQPMQLATLSPQEMHETDGSALWMVPIMYWGLRMSFYAPSVGVVVLHQAPRIGVTIDKFIQR